MDNATVISHLTDLIAEADEVADACSTLGHDDDSYEAGDIRDEAASLKEALEKGDTDGLLAVLDDSCITTDNVEGWLEEAKERLAALG